MAIPNRGHIAKDIYSTVLKLIRNIPEKTEFRLVGVGISGFEETAQLNMFDTDNPNKSWEKSEKAIDNLAQKIWKVCCRPCKRVEVIYSDILTIPAMHAP